MDAFHLEHLNEQITDVIKRLTAGEGFPTGIVLFDQAWLALNLELTGQAPEDCLLRRRMVLKYLDQLVPQHS